MRQLSSERCRSYYQLACAFEGAVVWGNAGINNQSGSATPPNRIVAGDDLYLKVF